MCFNGKVPAFHRLNLQNCRSTECRLSVLAGIVLNFEISVLDSVFLHILFMLCETNPGLLLCNKLKHKFSIDIYFSKLHRDHKYSIVLIISYLLYRQQLPRRIHKAV